MLVSFPPLSYMLKSSGSSYQFEARLGGRHTYVCQPSVHPCGRLQPATVAIPTTKPTCTVNDRCCLATTYHAGKQTVRCTGICAVRLFTSGDTARLDRLRPGWDGPSFRTCEQRHPTQWAHAAKTRRVRTTGTQTGMLPGISRKRNVRSKF